MQPDTVVRAPVRKLGDETVGSCTDASTRDCAVQACREYYRNHGDRGALFFRSFCRPVVRIDGPIAPLRALGLIGCPLDGLSPLLERRLGVGFELGGGKSGGQFAATAGPSRATLASLGRRTKADRNGVKKACPRRPMPA